jgi:uncharacterized protein (TIGR02996 family)
MSEHDGFLRKILENPADDGPRLAYADWLEERGEWERAEFLRVEHLLGKLPPQDRRRAGLKARLEDLTLDRKWVTAVSTAAVENCPSESTCPRRWDQLRPAAGLRVRVCDVCRRAVQYCHTVEEARNHVRLGDRVAVTPVVPRYPCDLQRRPDAAVSRVVRQTRVPTRRPTLLHRLLSQGQP